MSVTVNLLYTSRMIRDEVALALLAPSIDEENWKRIRMNMRHHADLVHHTHPHQVFYMGMVCLHAYLVFKYFVKQTLAIAGALVGGLAGSYVWNVLIRWVIGFPMGNVKIHS